MNKKDADLRLPFPELAGAALSEQLKLCSELLGRQPVSHHWDSSEPRALVLEMEIGKYLSFMHDDH